MSHKTLDTILNGLMYRYKDRVPDVNKVLNALVADGVITTHQDVQNDHIAFRTMGVPQLGIQSFEKIFLHHGYQKRDYYYFEGKKLNAYWYSPPQDHYPRIFISELCVDKLDDKIQVIIKSYTDEVKSDPVDALNVDDGEAVDTFLHTPLWRTPTWADYQALAAASEYAAWVIYNRYYLNHFTISVHELRESHNTIEKFNAYLEGIGITLNDAGGKIKTSGDGKLIQSSTVAEMVEAKFADQDGNDTDIHEISGSYVEFAERQVLDEFRDLASDAIQRKHRRDGFETGNADKIFESTYSSQTDKS